MFHKEGSFHNKARGKKSNDTPLNKSLRKKLRDTFLTSILPEAAFASSAASVPPPLVQHAWDDFFLKGEISLRKIKLPDATSNAGATCIYLRSPSNVEDVMKAATAAAADSTHNEEQSPVVNYTTPSVWPYTKHSQVLLLQVDQIMLPSLALLSVLPQSILDELPTAVVHPVVSKYLCRGADLMRSGMVSISPYHKGWVVIRAMGNPQPFAVGFVTRGTDEGSIGAGKKGVGVKIVTCYGDEIYKSQVDDDGGDMGSEVTSRSMSEKGRRMSSTLGGDVYDHGNYGNVGFVQGKQVYALRGFLGTCDDDENEEEESSSDNEGDEEDVQGDEVGEYVPSEDASSLNPDTSEEVIRHADNTISHEATKVMPSNNYIQEDENNDNERQQISDDDNNDAETILLQAFHDAAVRISKSQLPMPTSTFYSQHILPARREGSYIDLKATRYKKIGTFLLEQAEKGIITLGASNGDAVAFLKSVDKSHVDLREARQRKRETSSWNGSATQNQSHGSDPRKKTALVNLYIVPHSIVSSMRLSSDDVKAMNAKSEDRRGTGYLTASECRDILNSYVQDNELVDEFDPEMVRLDGPLCDALYRKSHRELQKDSLGRNAYPESVTRKELNIRWLEKMDNAYAIVSLPGSSIISMKRGDAPKISFLVETRQNRKKFITRVRGLEEYGVNPASFANDVSKRFACSATIEDEAHGREKLKKGHVECIFQGHLVEELQALLLGDEKLSSHGGTKKSDYCLPKGIFEVSTKGHASKTKKK